MMIKLNKNLNYWRRRKKWIFWTNWNSNL